MNKVIYILLSAILLISCNNDDDSSNSNVPTASQFNDLINNSRTAKTQTQSFNLSTGDVINYTSPKGTKIRIEQNCLRKNGNAVTGSVTLKFLEVYDTADMALTGVTTMGYNINNQLQILKSGGAFEVAVYQDQVLLDVVCNYTLDVPYNLTGGFDSEMLQWNGSLSQDNQVEWTLNADATIDRGLAASYMMILSDFGWFNIDRFYNDSRPLTAVSIKVPQIYHAENSNMYFTLDEVPNSLGNMSTFTGSTNSFNINQLPIGATIHFIFITPHNGAYIMAIKSGTISSGANFQIQDSDLQNATESQLISHINSIF